MVPKKRTYNNSEILTGECESCNQILPIEKFDIASKQGDKIYYRSKCHDCYLCFRKQYRKENNHQNIAYKLNNKDNISEYNKRYYIDNKEHLQDLNSNNYQKYKENGKALEYGRKFREKNREKSNSYARKSYKKKRKEDIGFRINSDISRSIRRQLKINDGSKNNESCTSYLPFTIEELKQHLESQFEPWMIWENRGKYNSKNWDDNDSNTWTWNIDHIIPQSKLPYTNMTDENFKKCWALENLRPLSAKQNIKDGNRR